MPLTANNLRDLRCVACSPPKAPESPGPSLVYAVAVPSRTGVVPEQPPAPHD